MDQFIPPPSSLTHSLTHSLTQLLGIFYQIPSFIPVKGWGWGWLNNPLITLRSSLPSTSRVKKVERPPPSNRMEKLLPRIVCKRPVSTLTPLLCRAPALPCPSVSPHVTQPLSLPREKKNSRGGTTGSLTRGFFGIIIDLRRRCTWR